MTRILVVDDDGELRAILCKLIVSLGHEVVEATNGLEAIELFRRNPTDIILTDLMMPRKDGFQAIRKLRDEYPSVRIIAMSGGFLHGAESYLKLAEILGAQHTLTKPFSGLELRRTLALVLRDLAVAGA